MPQNVECTLHPGLHNTMLSMVVVIRPQRHRDTDYKAHNLADSTLPIFNHLSGHNAMPSLCGIVCEPKSHVHHLFSAHHSFSHHRYPTQNMGRRLWRLSCCSIQRQEECRSSTCATPQQVITSLACHAGHHARSSTLGCGHPAMLDPGALSLMPDPLAFAIAPTYPQHLQ